MNNTIEFLNAVIAKTDAPSDYAIAKILDVNTATVSIWRCQKGTMGNKIGLKVASILEIDQDVVLAALNAERATTDTEKAAWTALFERLGGLDVKLPSLAMARVGSGATSHNTAENLYIM